jgi:hypothetical protein
MSTDQITKAADWGYDAPEQQGGLYLTLRKAGDKARIRIASRPLKFSEMVKFNDKTREVFCHAWVVIHKEIVADKPVKTVKGFKGGPMIYSLIYSYIINEEWGDPTHYDLEIVRTEEKGNFYTVTPLPRAIGPISEADLKLVNEAALDLNEMYLGKSDEETPPPNADDDPFADDPKYEAPIGGPNAKA